VELIQSRAKFLDPHTLEVDGRKITAEKNFNCRWGRPVKPDLPGAEYTITSNEMFHLPEQPKHIAILGVAISV
jgi:glutathione reductase (NADPH)